MIESKVFSPNAFLGWSFQVFPYLEIMTPVDMFQWRLFRQTVVWCPKNKLIAGSWMSIFAGPPELHKKAQVDVGWLDGMLWVFHKTDQVWTLGFVEVALPMSELMESLTASVVGVPQSKNGNEPSRAEVHSANPKRCLLFGDTSCGAFGEMLLNLAMVFARFGGCLPCLSNVELGAYSLHDSQFRLELHKSDRMEDYCH